MKLLEKVYNEPQLIRYVRAQVDSVAHLVTNTEKLEAAIYKQLGNYYALPRNNISIYWARRLVDREVKRAKERYGKQNSVLFSDLAAATDGYSEIEYDPIDALASVEESVIDNLIKEKVTALARDDKEMFVLKAWSIGYNDSEISRALASRFGGNPNSLRVYVNRLKEKCQKRLIA